MCCLRCCDGFFNGINRLFNGILTAVGLAFVGLGLFLAHAFGWSFDYFTLSVVSAGGFVALLALGYAACGHKSYCFTTAYIWGMLLLIIADAVGAGLILTKKDEIITGLKKELKAAGIDTKHITKQNVEIGGYAFAMLACIQILALVLAYCHRSHLIDIKAERADLEDGYDLLDNEAPSAANSRSKQSKARANELAKRGKRNGRASRDDMEAGASEGQKAASAYRSKYADLYEKYGIEKN